MFFFLGVFLLLVDVNVCCTRVSFPHVAQISSPRLLPLKGLGKVTQAVCGGTQVAVLNGMYRAFASKDE